MPAYERVVRQIRAILSKLDDGDDRIAKERETDVNVLIGALSRLSYEASTNKTKLSACTFPLKSLYDEMLHCDSAFLSQSIVLKHSPCEVLADFYKQRSSIITEKQLLSLQVAIRFLLMHHPLGILEYTSEKSCLHHGTLEELEKASFEKIVRPSAKNDDNLALPWTSYAKSLLEHLPSRQNEDYRSTFVVASTIVLNQAHHIEQSEGECESLYMSLLEITVALRRDWLSTMSLSRHIYDRQRRYSPEDDWTDRFIRWTIKRMKMPLADDLYQLATEFLMLSRSVPSVWGTLVDDEAIYRAGTTFRRNPATGILAYCAPERAMAIREDVHNTVNAFSALEEKKIDTINASAINAWEMGVAALDYAIRQECELNWMESYYIDDVMGGEIARRRCDRFVTKLQIRHAPALIHVEDQWYLKYADKDEYEHIHNSEGLNAWAAMGAWCRHVFTKMKGVPCRGKTIKLLLQDIETA